jgi:hypothetical protein
MRAPQLDRLFDFQNLYLWRLFDKPISVLATVYPTNCGHAGDIFPTIDCGNDGLWPTQ